MIDTFGDRQYAIANQNGVVFTNDITANPVVWTQLDAMNDPAAAGGTGGFLRASVTGGTPTFYVLSGTQLWSFQGTNSATANWTRIDNNPGGGAIQFFTVDEANPNRLYAIRSGGAAPNRIIFSNDGGANWNPDPELDNLMTLGGFFRNFAATFIAFDPSNSSFVIAGGLDSGVFLSTDSGNSWRLITDPIDSGYSGVPHLPEPRFAYFDHEPAATDTNIYIGTRGRGVWRHRRDQLRPGRGPVRAQQHDRQRHRARLAGQDHRARPDHSQRDRCGFLPVHGPGHGQAARQRLGTTSTGSSTCGSRMPRATSWPPACRPTSPASIGRRW